MNTQLVVSQPADYVDTIDQLYEHEEKMPHFVKGHYIIEFFRTSKNKKLNAIYRRAMMCDNCVEDQEKYLKFMFYEHNEEERKMFDTHVVVR